MKKIVISILLGALSAGGVLVAQSAQDAAAFHLLKDILSKKSEYRYMLRTFQYTSTTKVNNPNSWVLSSYSTNETVTEAGLTPQDKGKYISALKDRSPARVKRLWNAHKKFIFETLTIEDYKKVYLNYAVDDYIKMRESAEYKDKIAKLNAACPNGPCNELMNEAYQIGGGGDILFWFRREREKNSEVVFEILKEIQTHYNKPL